MLHVIDEFSNKHAKHIITERLHNLKVVPLRHTIISTRVHIKSKQIHTILRANILQAMMPTAHIILSSTPNKKLRFPHWMTLSGNPNR